MKRNIVIATVTAAALVGGGTASAFALAGSDHAPAQKSSTRVADRDDDGPGDDDGVRDHDDSDGRGDNDGRGDGRDDRSDDAEARAAEVSLSEAVDAALKAAPGTVSSVDLDDNDAGKAVWDVDVLGKDGKWHDLTLDASTAKVLNQHIDRDEDTSAAALRAADVSAVEAARKAAAKGTVTSVDFDDDHGSAWEVEVTGKDHRDHDMVVDPRSGKVTTPPADDDGDNDDNDGDDD